ncbi:T9SS type A sorting domain-containing protein [candidate division WOR-3 bacterium]|uniref:T9SS type A sorting domain-containing protein n=1 Tax=candidate division WOR-3 bacterium TaxID=2052148 RepID=A0A937XDN9_UNCW3|nr:T9SS type A sorting domain-containing protein [candidate division WOR-3 bacterium]
MRKTVLALMLVAATAGVARAARPTTATNSTSDPVRTGRVTGHIAVLYDRAGKLVGGNSDAVSGDSLYWKSYNSTTYLKSSAKDHDPAPADRTAMAFQDNQTVVCMDPSGDYVYEVLGSTMRRFSTTDGSDTSFTLAYPGNGACGTDGQYVYVPRIDSIYKYTTTGTYVNTTKINFSTNQYAFAVTNDTLWAGDFSGVTYYGYACARFEGESLNYDATWNVGGGTGGAGMNIAFDGTYYYWAMGGYQSNTFKRFYSDRTLYTEGMVSTDCRGVMCKVVGSPRADVACVELLAPADTVDSGATITPQAVIRNVGTTDESFDAWFSIGSDYADTVSLRLAAGASDTVEFAGWEALDLGTLAVTCSTMLSGDVDSMNDAVHDSVEVVPFTGIRGRFDTHGLSLLDEVLPNPTSGRVAVSYRLPNPTEVRLSVYSSAGVPVWVLQRGVQDAGPHQVSWDGRDEQGRRVAAGVYLLRLEAGRLGATRKLVVHR